MVEEGKDPKGSDEDDDKKERQRLKTYLKIGGIVGAALAGITLACTLKALIDQRKRKKFLKKFADHLLTLDLSQGDRIKIIKDVNLNSQEARYLYEGYREIRKGIFESDLSQDGQNKLNQVFTEFLRQYGKQRKIPAGKRAEVEEWDLDAAVRRGQ